MLRIKIEQINHTYRRVLNVANYKSISRLDRRDGRIGGGICVYAKHDLVNVVHVADSTEANDHGIIFIQIWA